MPYTANIQRLGDDPPFEDDRSGWWGYRVAVPGVAPVDYWILGADYIRIKDGHIQREAVEERFADGRNPFLCDDPHPDDDYDPLWDVVIEDLHASDNPPIYSDGP